MTTKMEPVRKERVIPGTPEKAFELFTAGISRWWPVTTHSVECEAGTVVAFEGEVGGRLFERSPTGTEHEWGKVSAWEAGKRVVVGWHPGGDGSTAQELEVCFDADEGGTKLTLEHRGFEVLGDRAEDVRDDYDDSWDEILDKRYLAAATKK